jgi:hypothetical protein
MSGSMHGAMGVSQQMQQVSTVLLFSLFGSSTEDDDAFI